MDRSERQGTDDRGASKFLRRLGARHRSADSFDLIFDLTSSTRSCCSCCRICLYAKHYNIVGGEQQRTGG